MAVIFAALVVEAVADLMADHRADAAIIHRIVGLGIEERRLQDGGGKDDLVEGGIVIGVDGGRRHAPFGAIHRLVDAVEFTVPFKNLAALNVAHQIVALTS